MLVAMGHVIGFYSTTEMVAGFSQITPPESAHAEEISALCSGDGIIALMVEEGLPEFTAIVEAAALQPGEAETAENRWVHGLVKLTA